MATTSNYGWTIPDDTDLVKNGALAIRTLGNAIDTTAASSFGGGLVHIVTANTGGAVSSFSVNDCFSATFNTYRIILDLAASVATGLNLRLRVGGADTSTGIYKRQVLNTDGASNSGLRSTTLTAWDSVWIADITTKNSYPHNNFEIYRPFETVTTTGHRTSMGDPDGNIEMNHAIYGIGNTLSYTGFTLIPASGTINGTATVLGIKI